MTNINTQAVVKFISNGTECIAGIGFGVRSINFRVCVITISEKQDFSYTLMPDGVARCSIAGTDEATIWFDTDKSSAKQINDLFQSSSIQ